MCEIANQASRVTSSRECRCQVSLRVLGSSCLIAAPGERVSTNLCIVMSDLVHREANHQRSEQEGMLGCYRSEREPERGT